MDLGNVTSKTASISLAVNDKLTITAYDSDADGTDDQIEGHESWFAEAEVISAPIGVNDSYQIAAGSSLDMTIGPFAHYQFDGDIKDVSGNGYDLNKGGPPDNIFYNDFFRDDRFDEAKKSLNFYGGATTVEYPHDDAFNFKGQSEWSIYFWVKMDKRNLPFDNGIMSKSDVANGGWFFVNFMYEGNISSRMKFLIGWIK